MSNNRVIHFEIQADDVKRAADFYRKTFGWEIDQVMKASEGPMDYWGVKTGPDGTPGINGGLYERRPDHKLYTYDCTLQVPDLDKAIDAVKKYGGKILNEKMEIPGVGWFARAEDTEGNLFGIMQPTDWQAK